MQKWIISYSQIIFGIFSFVQIKILSGWMDKELGLVNKDKLNWTGVGEGSSLRLVAYGHIRIIIIKVHIITRNSRHLNHEHYPLDLKTLKVTLTNHKILNRSLKTKKNLKKLFKTLKTISIIFSFFM